MPKDMETNKKLMALLRFMDEPEEMTEDQLQELLADDDVREAYELMADCKKVYERESVRAAISLRHGRGAQRMGWVFYRKVAAVFLAAAFLGGLAWAISPLLSSPKGEESQSSEVTSTPLPHEEGREEASSPVRFSNIRLDSILTVVSFHYGKAVCYRNEEMRDIKFITTWNPADSLAAFIEHLNMFDYLHLTLQEDTIFVESVNEEDK